MSKILNVATLRVACKEGRKLLLNNTLTDKQIDNLCSLTERKEDTIFLFKTVMLHEQGDRNTNKAAVRGWLVWSGEEKDEPIMLDIPLARYEKLPEHTDLGKLEELAK